MQTSPARPQLQVPPAPPAQPEAIVGDPGANELNALSLSALKSRRSDLTTQLASVTTRRAELAHDLRRTNSLAQDGILQHIKQLDARIIQIESDIAGTATQFF
ncbi:MAG: hypothetical protein M3Y64_09645 [Gemmatimonadota bacterium]|nr:hypothetical protein [Gemmatimonadota bacterium]